MVKALIFEYIGKGTLFICTHEGICGSCGIVPLLLMLGSVWRWVVSFMPLLLLPGVEAPVLTEQEAGYAPASQSLLSRQKLLPLPGVKLQFCVHPAHGLNWAILSPFLLSLFKKRNYNTCIILVNTWLEKMIGKAKLQIFASIGKECVVPHLHWCPTVCRSEGNLNKNYMKDSNWHVVREHLLLYRVSFLGFILDQKFIFAVRCEGNILKDVMSICCEMRGG